VPGQRVAVVGHDPLQPGPDGESAGLVDAASVELQQQTLNGTVSNYTVAETAGTASFDLLLPEDGSSYLSAANPGVTVIHVYQRSTTDVHNLTGGISDGQSVQVRGLLFYYNPATPASIGKPVASTTGASQQPFHLVASRIMDVVVPPM
jgi:hypothetical protein